MTSSGWPSFSKYLVHIIVPTKCQSAEDTVLAQARVCNLRGLGPAWVYVSIYGNEMAVFPSRLYVP